MGWKEFRKGSHTRNKVWDGRHRFEHWYVDNQVYFITARVRGRLPGFRTAEAKAIFWDRFDHWISQSSYVPWVTSLQINHYHTLGYLKHGADLPALMKRLHGSVAKLVNDRLPERIIPFWTDAGHQNYFDGCIRDVLQARRAYRYTLTQSQRHRSGDWRNDANTRAPIAIDRAIKRATELGAFLESVPYARYDRRRARPSGVAT
ncbi:MAG TPA: hypothetical protein VF595_15800 [Tepidisphaeraceae bacterium]|jgi:REP element-mobilizing transposase RayT